jgi:hypothetical protein
MNRLQRNYDEIYALNKCCGSVCRERNSIRDVRRAVKLPSQWCWSGGDEGCYGTASKFSRMAMTKRHGVHTMTKVRHYRRGNNTMPLPEAMAFISSMRSKGHSKRTKGPSPKVRAAQQLSMEGRGEGGNWTASYSPRSRQCTAWPESRTEFIIIQK